MENTSAEALIESFRNRKVLIVGDIMLDEFHFGTYTRQSPEAEVPIIKVQNQKYNLGGAAHVSLTIKALGATPFLCGPLGNDEAGKTIEKMLVESEVSTECIFHSCRKTTVKSRYFVDSKQVFRIDDEEEHALEEEELEALKLNILAVIDRIEVIILQDYDKGCLTQNSIHWIHDIAQSCSIPMVVDPKVKNFSTYSGTALIKPNLDEFHKAFGESFQGAKSYQRIRSFLKEKNHQGMLLTIGEQGMVAVDANEAFEVKGKTVEKPSTIGAGDVVIAFSALAILSEIPLYKLATLANLYASIFCSQSGIRPVHVQDFVDQVGKERI